MIKPTFISSLIRNKNNKVFSLPNVELYQKHIHYPYKASKTRANIILNNMNKLKLAMTKDNHTCYN